MIRLSLVLIAIFLPCTATAVEYNCKVLKKVESSINYTPVQISNGKFSLKIQESDSVAVLSRCSFSSISNKVTCDKYRADKVVFEDKVKIKKYYVFSSQYDVQLFKDLTFVENNGRGGISYGKCQVLSP